MSRNSLMVDTVGICVDSLNGVICRKCAMTATRHKLVEFVRDIGSPTK